MIELYGDPAQMEPVLQEGVPMHALGSLLPNLYPAGDLDLDPEALKRQVRANRSDTLARQLEARKK